MNKECPKCGKRVTKKDKHAFMQGKRYHFECIDVAEYRDSLLSRGKK